jgi:hypothetical protein
MLDAIKSGGALAGLKKVDRTKKPQRRQTLAGAPGGYIGLVLHRVYRLSVT